MTTTQKFAVHTTATTDQIDHIAQLHHRRPQRTADGDCFYGWGEPLQPRNGCIPHTVIYGTTLDDAQWWAHELVRRGHQTIVTDHDEWYTTITNSTTPIYNRAEHAH